MTGRHMAIGKVDDDPDAVDISSAGVWLDCTLESGEPVRARWALRLNPGGRSGVWTPPPEPGDEVAILFEGGDPRSAVCIGVLPSGDTEEGSGDWSLPASIVSEPEAVHILGTARVIIDSAGDLFARSATKAQVVAPLVELGDAALAPTDGIVHGAGIDPFTGASYFALGNASARVRAART